jgi:hypothetical protein
LAVLAATALASTLTVTVFDDTWCSGRPKRNATLPQGQCLPHRDNRTFNKFTCVQLSGTRHAVELALWNDSACTVPRLRSAIQCNICYKNRMDRDKFMKIDNCDPTTGSARANLGCDSTCTRCEKTDTLNRTCVEHYKGKFHMSLAKVFVSNSYVRLSEYRNASCSGRADEMFPVATGGCEDGDWFECSSSRQRHRLL